VDVSQASLRDSGTPSCLPTAVGYFHDTPTGLDDKRSGFRLAKRGRGWQTRFSIIMMRTQKTELEALQERLGRDPAASWIGVIGVSWDTYPPGTRLD